MNVTVPVAASEASSFSVCVPLASSVVASRKAVLERPPLFSTEPPGRRIDIVPPVSVDDEMATATRWPVVPAKVICAFWPGVVIVAVPVAEAGATLGRFRLPPASAAMS